MSTSPTFHSRLHSRLHGRLHRQIEICFGGALSLFVLIGVVSCSGRSRSAVESESETRRDRATTHTPWDSSSRRFAVIVGHNHGSAGRLPLRFAETDAERVSLVFRELGDFARHNVHLLRGPTLAQLRSSLDAVATQIKSWRRDRVPGTGPGRAVLLVYFSGHSDGKVLELGDERLEHGELMQWIAGVGADLRVIIVDACRSGTLLAMKGGPATVKGGTPGPTFGLGDDTEASTGEAILASTGANEDALESAELGGSYFSHHLLSGLRGTADANRDGRISLSEAYAHAAARTAAETTGVLLGPQRPSYQIHLSGRGDFILTQLPTNGTVLEIPTELDRALVIDTIRGTVAAEWTAGSTPRIAVPVVPLLLRGWRAGKMYSVRLAIPARSERKVAFDELVAEAVATPPPPDAGLRPGRSGEEADRPPVAERQIRRAFSATDCEQRCLIDGRAERGDCPPPTTHIVLEPATANTPMRNTVAIDLPSRHSLVRVRFEVCDPQGMWLHVSDSPSGNGGGGDAGDFSNDAELELRGTGLYVWGNDYGRSNDLLDRMVLSSPGFVSSSGCSTRTLVLGDQIIRSEDPTLKARSEYSLRLDPAQDHEGVSDRRWYVGFNRSVGSDRPDRVGSGLAWLEICVR